MFIEKSKQFEQVIGKDSDNNGLAVIESFKEIETVYLESANAAKNLNSQLKSTLDELKNSITEKWFLFTIDAARAQIGFPGPNPQPMETKIELFGTLPDVKISIDQSKFVGVGTSGNKTITIKAERKYISGGAFSQATETMEIPCNKTSGSNTCNTTQGTYVEYKDPTILKRNFIFLTLKTRGHLVLK